MKSGLLKRIKWKNVLLSIVVLCAAVFLCWKLVDKVWVRKSEMFELMPNNASLYIAQNGQVNWQKDASDLANKWIENSFLQRYLLESKNIQAALLDTTHRDMLAALYEINEHDYDFLHVVYLGFSWNTKPEKLFNKNFLASHNFQERVFKNYSIYESSNPDAAFAYTYKDGFLIISRASELIDNFIRKYEDNEVLSANSLFTQAYHDEAKENKETNRLQIILNYEKVNDLSELLSRPAGDALLQELSRIKGYSVLALHIEQANFKLHGCSAFDFDLAKTKTSSEAVNALLPANTAILSSIQVPPIKENKSPFDKFFGSEQIDQLSFFEIENRDINDEKYGACIIHSKNIQQSLSELKAFASKEQLSILYGKQKIVLQGTNIKNEFHQYFHHSFFKINAPYYFYINNCIIFVNRVETAQYIADHYFEKNTFSNKEQVSYQFHFQQDLVPQLIDRLFKTNDSLVDLSAFKNINQLNWRINAQNGSLLTDINFSVEKNTKQEASNIVWSNQLQEKCLSAPQIIRLANQEHFYVCAQDQQKQVYLFNDAGELTWKKELDSKLISNFYPIDYYNNASTQFAFHTENAFYVVDKYGNDIEGFPIRLGAPTNISMSVYYEKNSQHQAFYFIPCSNGNIYGYDVKGLPIPGWNPKSCGVLNTPIIICNQGNKHILVASTQSGDLNAFDLKGQVLFKLTSPQTSSTALSMINVDTSSYLFNYKHNNIVKYSLNGQVEDKAFGPSADTCAYIAFLPVNAKVPNHAVLEQNTLKIFDQAGKKLSSYAFKEDMNLSIQQASTGKTDIFICRNQALNKVYIITASGQVYDGFPVTMLSTMSVINIGANTYAVGMSEDYKLVCYRL